MHNKRQQSLALQELRKVIQDLNASVTQLGNQLDLKHPRLSSPEILPNPPVPAPSPFQATHSLLALVDSGTDNFLEVGFVSQAGTLTSF
ncbi:hypothetical protein AAFF_G00315310 [Aldrovandia affinis]|uniref:Uncharacterized protein n=1 Tax=Aldrovandia affinis TaxID=143900 RepID=A0AAD7WQD1_9TELE|nr:hypothetical protein AAFF_G00315310 [Aldrovandia affinis]